jgi:hypothetical protein
LLLTSIIDAYRQFRRFYRPRRRRHIPHLRSKAEIRRRAVLRLKRACGKSSAITTIIGERMQRF